MHYVYVLRSTVDDGFYVGYSANLRKRFEQHLRGYSFATSYRAPWKLIYYEAYLEQADTLGRERYLKERCRSAFPQNRSSSTTSENVHRKKPRESSFYADLHARAQ